MPGGAVVLLSGGLDSAVFLAMAVVDRDPVVSLTFDYGQRCAAPEVAAARNLTRFFGVEFQLVSLPFLGDWASVSSLVDTSVTVPHGREALEGRRDLNTPDSVWIPNRNGLFINAAAALAEARGLESVMIGINAEEGEDFPDNTMEYLERVNRSLAFSTLNKVTVEAPTGRFRKREIVQLGARLGVDFSLIYSCYRGTLQMCGTCESCMRTKQALEDEEYEELVAEIFECE